MAGDGGVAGVRQAELHQPGAARAGGVADVDPGQEAVDQQRAHFVAAQLHREAGADQPAAATQQRYRRTFWRIGRQQHFLGGAATLHQLRQAAGRQLLRRLAGLGRLQPRLGGVRQHQVHVVAAQHQVLADADALQHRFAMFDLHADQAEVGGAAADVGHQDQPALRQVLRQRGTMPVQPVMQRCLRFLDQVQPRQSGQPCRFQRQRPGAFVERGGNGEDQILPLQRCAGKTRIPGASDMGQIAGAGRQRRDFLHIVRSAPRQDGCAAVHCRMR